MYGIQIYILIRIPDNPKSRNYGQQTTRNYVETKYYIGILYFFFKNLIYAEFGSFSTKVKIVFFVYLLIVKLWFTNKMFHWVSIFLINIRSNSYNLLYLFHSILNCKKKKKP